MSIIFGVKEGNRIIIAGDKRVTNSKGDYLSDSQNKVVIINEHLAFVTAGNTAISELIQMEVREIKDKEKLKTNELLDIIKKLYQKNKSENAGKLSMFLNLSTAPFCFIIAGKNQYNKASLICGCNNRGNLETNETDSALFQPEDVNKEKCCDCFTKNYKFYHSVFVERTIREISEMSQLVSMTGDKWVFNTLTEKGVFYTF